MADSDFRSSKLREVATCINKCETIALSRALMHGGTILAAIFCKKVHSKINVGVDPNGHTVSITRWIYHVKMCPFLKVANKRNQ